MPLKGPAYHLPGSSIPGDFQKLKLRSISVLASEPVKINEQTIKIHAFLIQQKQLLMHSKEMTHFHNGFTGIN